MKLEYTDHKEDYVKKYEELHELIIQRDNEIDALKHMLDRKDDEKWDLLLRTTYQFWLKIMIISSELTYQHQKELSYPLVG